MYSFSYLGWLQVAAEFRGCSQNILRFPLFNLQPVNSINLIKNAAWAN